jgi:hypothetical protein
MPIVVSPTVAMRDALASHLGAGLLASFGLSSSVVLGRWPEPTEDLTLDRAGVVVGLDVSAEPKTGARIGGPFVSRVTLGAEAPAASFRYDYDQIEQELVIGVWASSEPLRDDADEAIGRLLNLPFWSTIEPAADTTLAAEVFAGRRWVAPASVADIWPGCVLRIDSGGAQEHVTVLEVSPVAFLAVFRFDHEAGAEVVEVAARGEAAAVGLSLRLENHHGVTAGFRFGEARRLQDAQRQEWRSVRKGLGRAVRVRVVEGVARQASAVAAQLAIRDPEAEAAIVFAGYGDIEP